MNKRWRNIGLTALLVLAIVVIAPAFFNGGNSQQEARTMRYSDFVEAVEENQISRVLISPAAAPLRWSKMMDVGLK